MCSAPSLCKSNKIINFLISVKLLKKIHFPQGPVKTYIFFANRFLCVLQKKSWNKLCISRHDTYFWSISFSLRWIIQIILFSWWHTDPPIRPKVWINQNFDISSRIWIVWDTNKQIMWKKYKKNHILLDLYIFTNIYIIKYI